MTLEQLIEYVNNEKRLRGMCVFNSIDMTENIIKKYPFPAKYLNHPLWCISSESMQVEGVILVESFNTVYGDGEISHYEWNVAEFFPMVPFKSPFKRPKNTPTVSFESPQMLTVESFQKVSSFKKFIQD